MVGTFPFNSFLSGLFCCLGTFVLGVSLRFQLTEAQQQSSGAAKFPLRPFADFVFCNLILFLAAINFIG